MLNTTGTGRPQELQPLPIMGMMYRWGVDLCGPFIGADGKKRYIMVMIEHFSKHVELAVLTSKDSAETAQVFLDRVIARFGAPAEVVTDQGKEFQGEFDVLMRQCFIDHRPTSAYHPQADGAAERIVQTIKKSLTKYAALEGDLTVWETWLPWVGLGYRCSKQASTGFSPYALLYGVEPTLPPAVKRVLEGKEAELAFAVSSDRERMAELMIERARLMQERCSMAGSNLKIAQHRDTLRYARTRSGSYHPRIHQYLPGDYVYVQKPAEIRRNLVPGVGATILKVVEVRPTGVVTVQGRCTGTQQVRIEHLRPCHLPDIDPVADPSMFRPPADWPCEVCGSSTEAERMLLCDVCNSGWHIDCIGITKMPGTSEPWLCPGCKEEGIDYNDLAEDRAAQAGEASGGDSAEPKRPSVAEEKSMKSTQKKTVAAAQKLDGKRVWRSDMNDSTYRLERQEGVLKFQGGHNWPRILIVEWDGGGKEYVSLRQANQLQAVVVQREGGRSKRTGGAGK
jgi:transposase InsO family protein